MQPSHVVAAPGHQVVPMRMAPSPVWRSKHSCIVRSLGIVQIILAGITVLACAVKIIGYYYGLGFAVAPLCGALATYLPAGILGILSVATSVSGRRCVAIACLVMSILAACFAGINIVIASVAIPNDVYWTGLQVAMDSVLVLISLAELVIAILASVYCCLIMREMAPFGSTMIQYTAAPGYPMINQPVPQGYPAGVYAPNMPIMVSQPVHSSMAVMSRPPSQPPSYASGVVSTTGDQAEEK